MMARHALTIGVLVGGLLAAAPARADSHGWSGRLGPIKVDVWRYGFADGAGAGGWSAERAAAFAAWAGALRDALPSGVGLDLRDRVEDGDVVIHLLRCRPADPGCARPGSRRVLPAGKISIEPERATAAAILRLVSRALGHDLRLPRARRVPVYTIQLLAARDAAQADALAARIGQQFAHEAPLLFDEGCGPCSRPNDARIVAPPAGGAPLYRVIVGNYESPRAAEPDRAALARLGFGRGIVRRLEPTDSPEPQ